MMGARKHLSSVYNEIISDSKPEIVTYEDLLYAWI